MTGGYEECPDRDPKPTRWGMALDLVLLVGLIEIVLALGTR